ncbi:MarR family transcriptional regulator [Mycobacterium cookii]|uniref:MarR family transcriptional regulator n=1 Tax=Mycobacterium cookii TaxID=1775 RepID=A0A7I7L3E1_9MYCO|nr:MarR family winged helix-turn-helix transcriptional regulator [Mycobacterium cookii]MCV7329613.1 winged helix-turn-helix transcriptional regulator [Mycobacterium cookii]BBX48547.1 MarR family transcriptional regulator [Mycobacterium cookii]
MTGQQGLSEQELAAWRSFMTMQHSLGRHLTRRLKQESGLSDSDFEVLVNLSESPHGRMRAVQLAAVTQWDKTRLSHHLSRMEKRGLIRRQSCDARYPDIVLTDAGRDAFVASAPANAARVRRCFIDVLGPQRLETLRQAAEDVIAAVQGQIEPTPI